MRIILFLLISILGTLVKAQSSNPATPQMSANFLFLYQNSNFHQENVDPANVDEHPNGLNVQDIELQFSADIDPKTHVSLLLGIHPHIESDGTTVEEHWNIEPEEVFAETYLLKSATFKVGKFKAFIGQHNLLHPHAFAFVHAPMANEVLLGEEGFTDLGVSTAILIPAPWSNELTIQYFRGEGENEQFKSPTPSDGVGLVHWAHLWDLSQNLSMEIGGSYAKGGNSLGKETVLSGGDLTFKWRPDLASKVKSLIWSTEYLSRTQEQDGASDEKGYGIASWFQYQISQTWAGLYRYDNLKISNSFDPANVPSDLWERHSLAVVYMPSEVTSFKFEYGERQGGLPNAKGDKVEKAFFIQAKFEIGSHKGHSH